MTTDEELADLFGEAAHYAEHRRGDHIRYRHEGLTHQGTILWVAAPQDVAGTICPLTYIVEPDGETDTFPQVITPGDVLGLVDGQEPTLTRCKYCTGFHQENEIERCPLNPNR